MLIECFNCLLYHRFNNMHTYSTCILTEITTDNVKRAHENIKRIPCQTYSWQSFSHVSLPIWRSTSLLAFINIYVSKFLLEYFLEQGYFLAMIKAAEASIFHPYPASWSYHGHQNIDKHGLILSKCWYDCLWSFVQALQQLCWTFNLCVTTSRQNATSSFLSSWKNRCSIWSLCY